MPLSDRNLGILGLCLSCSVLGFLFLRLLIIPILPLDEDNPLNLDTPITILLGCGFFGLFFIGSLSGYTLLKLYRAKVVKGD